MPDRCVTSTRAGSEIIIRVQCGDDYEAMELHDRIIATVAEKGQVNYSALKDRASSFNGDRLT
jgi:hypothetical protein